MTGRRAWHRRPAAGGGMAGAQGSGQRGGVAIELALGVGLLLLPTALLVLTLPQWSERQLVARVAAQEAARAAVTAADAAEAEAAAARTVARTAANHGLDPGDLTLTLSGDLQRGATVTATLTVVVPAAALPVVGTTPAFSWSTSATEQVDRYRSLTPAARP